MRLSRLYLLFILGLLLATTSCISTKRLTYIQQDDEQIDSLITVQRVQKPYRIQINDLLSIRIKALDQDLVGIFNPVEQTNITATNENELYYDGFRVDQHGNIRMPTIGELNVLGSTLEEIRIKIKDLLLKNYFKEEANIFVTVKLPGIRYTTLGEIGTGSQVVYKEQVSIFEAIANAGDITVTGNRKDVILMRQYPGGSRIHHLDLTSINVLNSPYYYIQPNDLIYVKPLPQKALGTGTTGLQTFSTIASIVSLFGTLILLSIRLNQN